MHTYSVGQPYNPTITRWPECALYSYRSGEHELLLFLEGPSKGECLAVKKGDAKFALLLEGDVIFLLYSFGAQLPWSDAPFSYHLVEAAERTLPPLDIGQQERALLSVTLIDAATGLIRAMRALSLSHRFTEQLHAAIHRQAARTWSGRAAYQSQVDEVRRRYRTPDLMARGAATLVIKGGS